MAGIDLSARFPEMRPIKGPPTLQTINGCGTTIYGSRDHDAETGTYVITQFITIVFIPVLALAAYRVASAGSRGWYFLGRESLSTLAKAWNTLVAAAVVTTGIVVLANIYFDSADYRAGRTLARAEAAQAEGRVGEAGNLYREVAGGSTSHAPVAEAKFKALVELVTKQGTLTDATAIYEQAVQWNRQQRGKSTPAELTAGALSIVNRSGKQDPENALKLLDIVSPIAPDPAALLAPRQQLLEQLVAKQPGNVDYVVRLSVIYEAQNKPAQCRKMLEPLAARLGTTEGARVLGQIYARENEPDKSHELLMPYAQKRLKQLHDAEQNFTAVYKRVATRVIDMLKQERAPGFSYDRYKSLPEPQQEAMVDEYIQSQIKDDPELMRARDELAAQGQVVPVALDLGVVLLERAQRKQDPQARQADLHEAEQMFLAVRGQAGEQDMYRLYLGQVDYWLGKHDEGRKLFDELMAAHQDKGEVVLAVARTLREVGAASEARQLAEKLYQKESEPKLKYAAATMISLTTDEPDEKILWLRRGDPNDKGDKATLEWLVGLQCRRRGADDEALQHLHASIDLYQGLVENSDTLNNSALVWFSLADATGDPDDFKQAAIRLEKASALGRSDSILLLNTSVALMTSALSDAVAKAIDLKMLHTTGNFELLSYLYHDAAQRKQLVANMQRNPDLRRSLEYLDKVMLLAPRSVSGYGQAYRFYGFSRDLTALKALANRLKPLELDLATQHARTLKFYSGQLDAEQLEDFQKSLPRLRRTLAAARAKGGPTLAAAAGSLCDGLAQASKVGYATDADELVRLAEEAQHAAPSAGSDSDLFTALTFRAARDLAKADPEFAAMQQRARRSLDSRMLIAAAIGRPGPLRERILANADVKRVEQMLLNNMRLYPESANGWQWAVLSASHPAEANQLAAIMRRDEISRLEIELARRLSPLSVDAAWEEYWMKQAADEPNPTAALKQCQQAGAPLPWEIK